MLPPVVPREMSFNKLVSHPVSSDKPDFTQEFKSPKCRMLEPEGTLKATEAKALTLQMRKVRPKTHSF